MIDPELEAAMHERARSEREADVETFARLTTDDFVLVNARGEVLDKTARIAELRDGRQPRFEVVAAAERVRMYGPDTAIRTRLAKTPDGTRVRFMTVWVKHEGQWKVASTQVTRIAD